MYKLLIQQYSQKYRSRAVSLQNLPSWFQTGTDTNLAVQVQKMAKGLKFQI